MDIATEVKKIIMEELNVDEGQITDDANFIDDLGADSLDTVELVMKFEDKFDIEIPEEDQDKLRTVGQAVSYLTSKLA